ncbi:MAG: hypothetical protein Q9181_007944 [Wetmoreana brouardii]
MQAMEDNPLVEPEATHAQAPQPPPPLIIKADELDPTGTDVSTPVPDVSTPITPALQGPPLQPPHLLSGQPLSTSPRAAPIRPILRREGSTPAPPSQPPPPAPQQQQQASEVGQQPTDSLSLLQLRRLVTDLPKLESQAYAYEHADARSFAEEVEEWFPYSEEEKYMLLKGREAFETQWERRKGVGAPKWTNSDEMERVQFVKDVIAEVEKQDGAIEGVDSLAYIAMGCWGETAGLEEKGAGDPTKESVEEEQWGGTLLSQHSQSTRQIKWIRKACELLASCRAAQCLFDVLRKACDSEQEADQATDAPPLNEEEQGAVTLNRFIALNQALTALYLLVEVGRWGPPHTKSTIQQAIRDLEPKLLHYLTQVIARTRWQDSPRLPFTRLLLLYWKTILLVFGTSDDLRDSKKVLRNDSDSFKDEDKEGYITASPLDYHLFRQEITSKYPAYNPPPPLIPIENENNSILPPLPNHPSRRTSQESLVMPNGPSAKDTPGSIFNQPVHIATPAPSPPPSPAGPGGKGGKKQNYQTNQNFPFLYPPFDATSNVGGQAELQDQIVGNRWEGSDVPASILEAGQLFASRMRMSRSLRQLWDVRERFIRHERGWNEAPNDNASTGSSGSMIEEDESDKTPDSEAVSNAPQKDSKAEDERETSDEGTQRRLDATEEFYSFVLVLWKVIFTNVSYLVAQANGTTALGVPNGISFPEDNPGTSPVKRKINISSTSQEITANSHPGEFEEGSDPVLEELNNVRLREILTKAIAAILLMLLKWFKLSHILKSEYLTQLLLDANYVPLILKLFAHQDIDRAVDQKNDRDDLK